MRIDNYINIGDEIRVVYRSLTVDGFSGHIVAIGDGEPVTREFILQREDTSSLHDGVVGVGGPRHLQRSPRRCVGLRSASVVSGGSGGEIQTQCDQRTEARPKTIAAFCRTDRIAHGPSRQVDCACPTRRRRVAAARP